MVRSDLVTSSSWPRIGRDVTDLRATLLQLLINLCKACEDGMSCIPPSAFSAGRIREAQQRDMKLANVKNGSGETPNKYYRTKFMELSPLKYNSKLMNSIWGFYNRYSPHNVKKVTEANGFPMEVHSPAALGEAARRGEASAARAPWPAWALWAPGSQTH